MHVTLVALAWFYLKMQSGLVFAAGSSVIINETHPAPSSGNEWVEITNVGSSPIPLQGWKLYDQLSSPSLLYEFGAVNLNPGEFIVLEVGSKLNNTGDGVDLKNASGDIIDTVSYANAQTGQSWSRYNNSNEFAWLTPTRGISNPATPTPSPTPLPTSTAQPSPTVTPSPTTTASPTPSPTTTPTPSPVTLPALVVSEIMACPASGESEWLEIFNPSNQAVTVQNWKITDASSNNKTLSGTLLPLEFTVLGWSGSLLNNAGDTFKLVSDTGVLISQGELDSCTSGESWIWSNGVWQANNTPTPGSGMSSSQTVATEETNTYLTGDEMTAFSNTSFEPENAAHSAEIKTPNVFPLSNQELMLVAPRLIEPAAPPNPPQPSLENQPNSLKTNLPTWHLLWIWGGILGGGLIILTSATYLLWQQYKRSHQTQQSPLKDQGGLSPFKWELG